MPEPFTAGLPRRPTGAAASARPAIGAMGIAGERPGRRSGRPGSAGIWMAVFLLSFPLAASATENGTSAFPDGGEDFLIACMPPPGWYGTVYFNSYTADSLADDSGNMALQSFRFLANGVIPRLDWVKPVSVLGADRWGTLALLPWLDLDLSLSPAPGVELKGSSRGFSDLTIGNGLHWTFPGFEMVNAVDVVLPTGEYDSSDLVSPGMNRWVIRLNHIGTWRPSPSWELSYRLHTDFNFRNPATDYTSGETVYLNWAAGWKPEPALTLGLAGYFLRQVSDDRQDGHIVGPDGNRVRVDGIGPCIKYILPNHIILAAKYFAEFDARNHPRGNQLWLYLITPLGPAPGA